MIKQISILWAHIKPPALLTFGWLLSFISSSALLVTVPSISAWLLDDVFAHSDRLNVPQIGWLLIGAIAAASIMATRFMLSALLAEHFVADLRRALFSKLIRSDGPFFDRHSDGELLSRLTIDIEFVRSFISQTFPSILRSLVVAVGSIITIFNTSISLSLVLMIGVAGALTPVVLAGKSLARLSALSQMKQASVIAQIRELLEHVRTVQAYQREAYECGEVSQSIKSSSRAIVKRILAHGTIAGLSFLVASFTLIFIWSVALIDLKAGDLTGGELSQFVLGALMATFALASLTEAWSESNQVSGGLSEVTRILAEVSPANDNISSYSIQRAGAHVCFAGVEFSYATRATEMVLNGLNVDISPGEVVAIVGPSGSGKSTLLALVMGFYKPASGRITVDGVDPGGSGKSSVRAVTAYVPQEPAIFSTSFRGNINYSYPNATDDELNAVVDGTCLRELVLRMEQGLNTPVGSETDRLSGGEKQRLEIARALLGRPRLLLLDEPTSALDGIAEGVLMKTLLALVGCTTIIVSHRLSTIRLAHRVIYMNEGKCVAEGSHESLLISCSSYSNFMNCSDEFKNAA